MENQVFLKLLVANGIFTTERVRSLHEKHKHDTFALLLHLARTFPSQKATLGRLWGDSIGISYVDLQKTLYNSEIVQLLPNGFAKTHCIILIYRFGEAITAALANPLNQFLLKDAEKITGRRISPVFSFPEDIDEAIEIEYASEDHLQDLSRQIITDNIHIEDIRELTKEDLERAAGSKSVVEFVHGLLLLAVKEGASDIHIEPGGEKVRVRFRIDGLLQERSKLEQSLLSPLVSRLKILANLDITERRRPQDGQINLKLPNRSIDFRFSSIPTIYGEKIVLRILGMSRIRDIPDISDLAFSKHTFDIIGKVMEVPHGIFFVTGPTGSGKTTTLFSMLKHLNRTVVNITTIEDPVEYKLEGASQVQMNAAAELDFAIALRAFLRQDPDIILVGEIRDKETAHIACQAALTGHLVLATLHTNNAVQAVTRLIDIGVEPFIVAPSLISVMCQRLVRKICDHCKEKYLASKEEISRFILAEGRQIHLYRGKGCPKCNGTGYSGRIAIHEAILVDNEIRNLIAQGASLSKIQHHASRTGFQSMRYDGIKKSLRGLTTLEEVNRVTIADEDLV